MSDTGSNEIVRGTLVAASHSWSSERHGEMQHRVRLDDGRLLVIKSALFNGPSYDGRDTEGTLTRLYNHYSDGYSNGIGHRLEAEIRYKNASKTKATLTCDVTDLGPVAGFEDKAFRDRGFVDSLPLIGRLRGHVIRCE